MADTIDTLELRIQSDSRLASDGLDRLVTSLLGLDKASKRGITGLSKFSADIQSFANAIKMLNRVKIPDMSALTNIKGDFAGLQNLSQGITALANSVQTLSGVKLGEISQAGTRLERLGRIDLSGFANAVRPLAGMDFSGVVSLGTSFRQFTDSMAGAEKVTTGTQKIFTALAQLAESAGNIPIIQQALPSLTAEIQKFISGMAEAPIVQTGTASLVSALSGIATSGNRAEKAAAALPNLTRAITDFVEALARAPALNNNVVEAIKSLSQFSVAGSSTGAAARSLQSSITGLSGSIGTLRNRILKGTTSIRNLGRSLLYAMGFAGGLYGAFRALRSAINISSDLTEVQNVVDVTFGDMADKIEKLSETSIQDFGLSELTLKQVASRFQAMGTAMGFSQEKMSDMSIELTKLAADMASFYNVSQDEVATSLQAVFTGQTRPLRRYGIDLTEATLKEWAMKKGLDANLKSMTQAEKTMLRYQYVMEASAAAQGDFARTSGTWANQVRILVENFKALGSVIGGTLINAFKPFVTALNSVMQSVIAFAETVANALGVIFGWTIRIDSAGIANDFDEAGEGAEALEDGTGGAADNAKKMSKYIAAWQEVNNMTTPEDSSGGGSGVGELGDGAAEGAEANLVKMETIFEKYKSEIDSLYELGEYIGETMTKVMKGINWDEAYESARNFGKGLADFLNGLISPELFGTVGKTIAGALNKAVYAALSFGETFDWDNFGEAIAAGINEFFRTFDFRALAQGIKTFANGILDSIISFLENVEWYEIGSKISGFIRDIVFDFAEVGKKIAIALWTAIKSGLGLTVGFFGDFGIESGLASVLTGIAAGFAAFKGLTAVSGIISSLGASFSGAISAIGVALAAHPAALIIAAITGIFGALAGLDAAYEARADAEFKEYISQFVDDLEEIGLASEESIKSLQRLNSGMEGVDSKAEFQGRSLDTLADNYLNLANQETLTNEQQSLMKRYSDELVKSVPLLADIIDDTTGRYKGQEDEIRKLIDAQKEYYKTLGYQEILTDYGREMAEAEVNLKKIEKQYDALAERRTFIADTWRQYTSQEIDAEEFFELTGVAANECHTIIGELDLKMQDLTTTQTELNGELETATENYYTATEAMTESQEAQKKITEGTTTFQQALSDLQSAFNGLDLSLDDDFVNELVMNGFDPSNLQSIFQSFADGVETSAESVKSVFKELGLSLPESLLNGFEEKSPESQQKIVSLLLELQSGLSLGADDLTRLFLELGIELPTNLRLGLASQDSLVQQTAIELLSKVESGEKLVEGNLKVLFSSLGIDLPDSLISAIASKNDDTQLAAIELIGQIKEANQSERKPLIDALNRLGIDVTEDGLIAALEGKETDVYNQATDTVKQADQAAVDMTDPLSDTMESTGTTGAKSFNTGLDSQDDEITTAAEGMRDAAKKPLTDEFNSTSSGAMYDAGANASKGFWQGIKDWWDDSWLGKKIQEFKNSITGAQGLDEHSPSRIMQQFGAWAIQGFNNGLESEIPDTYAVIKDWVKQIQSGSTMGISVPQLDYSIPNVDFSTRIKASDISNLQNTVQMELDERSAESEFGIREQNELLREQNELLRQIYNKPMLADADVFNATRRGQKDFNKRTMRTGWAGVD